MSVGGGTDGRSDARTVVEPAVVLPLAAQVIFRRHGQGLMELALKWQAHADRPGLVEAGWQLETSLGWLREAGERQAGQGDVSERGNAEVPQMDDGSRSERFPWCPVGDRASTSEVAEVLNVSERRVRQMIRDRQLSATLLGSRWLIDPASVEDERLRRQIEGGAA